MFSLKSRLNRFCLVAAAFILSLVSISILLATFASAQNGVPGIRARPATADGRSTRQVATVWVEPAVTVVGDGDTFRIHVMIKDTVDLGGFQFVLDYDPAIIEALHPSNPVALGLFLSSTGRSPTEFQNEIDPTTGVITYAVFTMGSAAGPDGSGMLAYVDFQARALGTSALALTDVEVTNTGGSPQDAATINGLAIVAASPSPAVSIVKTVDPPNVGLDGLLTYTIQGSFLYPGQHSYDEVIFDPIPDDATFVMGSAAWNDLPTPQLYSTTIDAIYHHRKGVFTDDDQWKITFQVQVEDLPYGTVIRNTVTEANQFDGAAYSGPHTSTSSATITVFHNYLPIVLKTYHR